MRIIIADTYYDGFLADHDAGAGRASMWADHRGAGADHHSIGADHHPAGADHHTLGLVPRPVGPDAHSFGVTPYLIGSDARSTDDGLDVGPYDDQLARLLGACFGTADAYASGLRRLGVDAQTIVVNAEPLQRQWAREHGREPDTSEAHWIERIFEAQVKAIRPDVVYVQEISALSDAFLRNVRRMTRLLVGQIACSLPPRRTFDAYDLIVSSWRPIVDHFNRRGTPAVYLPLGFDTSVLTRVDPEHAVRHPTAPASVLRSGSAFAPVPASASAPASAPASAFAIGSVSASASASDTMPRAGVTFVGGLSPVHPRRIEILEHLCRCTPIEVYGYGLDSLPDDSPIRERHRGPVWGLDMVRVLARSAMTVNIHGLIDVDGSADTRYANNCRLYEATGVGTLLITDAKDNLSEFFEPDREVVTFDSADQCAERIHHYLANPAAARAIARAGQTRTLRDHTYHHRMKTLLDILRHALSRTAQTPRTPRRVSI